MVIRNIEPVNSLPRIVRVGRSTRARRMVRGERGRARKADKPALRKTEADEVLKLLGIGRNINVLG